MALSDQQREAIIEEERIRYETRRLLLEHARASRPKRCRWGRCGGLGLLALCAAALLAFGCRQHHAAGDPGQRSERMARHLAKKLDLTAEQKTKTLAILRSLAVEREAWRGEGPAILGDLQAQFESSRFDAKALDQAFAQREKKLAASRALLVQKLGEFHAILSPEQRSKAAALLSKWEARWKKRAGPTAGRRA